MPRMCRSAPCSLLGCQGSPRPSLSDGAQRPAGGWDPPATTPRPSGNASSTPRGCSPRGWRRRSGGKPRRAHGPKAREARLLAERLFLISTQKGWASEALVYNNWLRNGLTSKTLRRALKLWAGSVGRPKVHSLSLGEDRMTTEKESLQRVQAGSTICAAALPLCRSPHEGPAQCELAALCQPRTRRFGRRGTRRIRSAQTMIDNWREVFDEAFGRNEKHRVRNFTSMALEARNATSHLSVPIQDNEALRYLDAMHQLLTAVKAPAGRSQNSSASMTSSDAPDCRCRAAPPRSLRQLLRLDDQRRGEEKSARRCGRGLRSRFRIRTCSPIGSRKRISRPIWAPSPPARIG